MEPENRENPKAAAWVRFALPDRREPGTFLIRASCKEAGMIFVAIDLHERGVSSSKIALIDSL